MTAASQPPNSEPAGRNRGYALTLAWIVEILAVGMGFVLAIYAGIEGGSSGFLTGAIALMPFMALAVIELAKIPLVRLSFSVKSLIWRCVGIVALLVVTGATFENFVFGFERGFNERIRLVEIANQEVRARENAVKLAETRIPHLQAQQEDLNRQLVAVREDIEGIRRQAQQDITESRSGDQSDQFRAERERLSGEALRLARERDINVDRERRRCGPDYRCSPSSILNRYNAQITEIERQIARLVEQQRADQQSIQSDVAAARERRDADLAVRESRRAGLQTQLEALRGEIARSQQTLLHGQESVAAAERDRDEKIERSQLHRLSMVMFGSHEKDTLEKTKRMFVMSLAAIVAVIGSVLAAMHYAGVYSNGRSRPLISNAIRAYFARKRRRVPLFTDIREAARQRHGIMRNLRGWLARRRREMLPVVTKEVVKEVEVKVERLKVVFLPLDASEEMIAKARREAAQEAA